MVEAFKKSPAKGLLSLAHCWAYDSDAFPDDVILKTFVLPHRWTMCFRTRLGMFYRPGSKFVCNNRDLRARLIAAWPGIFKWARYFYTQRVIYQLIQNKEVLAVVRRTHGIATFFTKLWVHSAAPPIVVSFIMHTLFHDATLDEIEAIAGNDDEKLIVAQVAVDRLRAAIKGVPDAATQSLSRDVHMPSASSAASRGTPSPSRSSTQNAACWVVTRMLVLTADVVVLRTAKASVVDWDSEYIESLNAGPALGRSVRRRWATARCVSAGAGYSRNSCISLGGSCRPEMNDIDDATLEKGVDGCWLAADWRSLQEVLTLRRSVAKISKEDKGTRLLIVYLPVREDGTEERTSTLWRLSLLAERYPHVHSACRMNGEDADEEVVVEHNKEMVRMVLRDPKAYTFIEATFAWGRTANQVPQMVNFTGKKTCANEDVEENTPGFIKDFKMNLGL
ncbi:hypothetical protein R3P38DRAFT_3472238 [Favolaschia claudopus]|uniref:Uncharacterized protein n=1 Tax=Favolaschia claudopus TaxID=2862362 RepID=A0AAV9ZBQ4_9AGAR